MNSGVALTTSEPSKSQRKLKQNAGSTVPGRPHLWALAMHIADTQVVFVFFLGGATLRIPRVLKSSSFAIFDHITFKDEMSNSSLDS